MPVLRWMVNRPWVAQLFLGFLVLALLIFIELKTEWKDSLFWVATTAIFTATVTGLFITIAEKFGWLAEYTEAMDKLGEKVSENKNALEHLELKINELPTSIQERLVYGLRSIDPDFNEVAFLSDHECDEIVWLNTYFRIFEQKTTLIREALKKGTKVRLLFLDPNSSSATEKAFYSAKSVDTETTSHTENAYRQRLRANVFNCISLIEDIKRELGGDVAELLEIRFYDDAPSLPIVAMASKSSRDEIPELKAEIAASGFYLDQFSSELPYITWDIKDSRGDQQLVHNLYNYFNRKWDAPWTRTLQALRETGDYDNWEGKAVTNLPPIS